MLNLLTMRQGKQERDDHFNKFFDDKLQTLDIAGGRKFLYIKDIIDKVGHNPADKDLKKE